MVRERMSLLKNRKAEIEYRPSSLSESPAKGKAGACKVGAIESGGANASNVSYVRGTDARCGGAAKVRRFAWPACRDGIKRDRDGI